MYIYMLHVYIHTHTYTGFAVLRWINEDKQKKKNAGQESYNRYLQNGF